MPRPTPTSKSLLGGNPILWIVSSIIMNKSCRVLTSTQDLPQGRKFSKGTRLQTVEIQLNQIPIRIQIQRKSFKCVCPVLTTLNKKSTNALILTVKNLGITELVYALISLRAKSWKSVTIAFSCHVATFTWLARGTDRTFLDRPAQFQQRRGNGWPLYMKKYGWPTWTFCVTVFIVRSWLSEY